MIHLFFYTILMQSTKTKLRYVFKVYSEDILPITVVLRMEIELSSKKVLSVNWESIQTILLIYF